MDNKKPQVGTSSSLTSQLFGPQGSSSTSDVLASIFPPSKARAPWENEPSGNQPWNTKDNTYKNGEGNSAGKEQSTIYHQEGAEPSYLSSSLYYGGRELYPAKSPNTNQSTPSYPISKKDGGEDDPTAASRGNWWQGSLYY